MSVYAEYRWAMAHGTDEEKELAEIDMACERQRMQAEEREYYDYLESEDD